MKEKTLEFNYVAETNIGGKSTIELFKGLDHKGEVAESFVNEFKYLESVSSEIDIKINSQGGSVMNGLSIVNTILDSKIPTTARIVGVVASMASVIALAADKTVMSDYAVLMWHNPFSPSGEAPSDQLMAFSAMLNKIYASRLGMSEEEVKSFMDGEDGKDGTWFNAEKAKSLGLISEIEQTGIQKTLEENLNSLESPVPSEDVVNELQMIAANIVISEKEKLDNAELEAAAVVDENVSASVTKNKKDMSTVSLENISASLNIKDADLEAINAKVKDIVATNASLESKVATTNEKLVEANSLVSEKDVEIASVSAELETANAVKVEIEAKVEVLEAKIGEFVAEKEAAHKLAIEDLVNDAADAGKITTEAKAHWVGLLEASFDFAKNALSDLTASEAKKVKLSEKIAPVDAKVSTEKEVEANVEATAVKTLSPMEAKLEEIKSKNANRKNK